MSIISRIVKGITGKPAVKGESTPAPADETKPVETAPAEEAKPVEETKPAIDPALLDQLVALFGSMKPSEIAKLIEDYKAVQTIKVEAESQIADLAKKIEAQGEEIKAMSKRIPVAGADPLPMVHGNSGTAKKSLADRIRANAAK